MLNNWIHARETALKKIREIKQVSKNEIDIFYNCLIKSLKNITSWHTDSEFQKEKIKGLIEDLKKFIKFMKEDFKFENSHQFNQIYNWSEENLNDECIEYIVSMMMEPYDDIVNPLISQMSSDEEEHFNIPVDRTIEDLRNILENKYSEILKIDFLKDENNQNFWFISKNKEEPRIGDRYCLLYTSDAADD